MPLAFIRADASRSSKPVVSSRVRASNVSPLRGASRKKIAAHSRYTLIGVRVRLVSAGQILLGQKAGSGDATQGADGLEIESVEIVAEIPRERADRQAVRVERPLPARLAIGTCEGFTAVDTHRFGHAPLSGRFGAQHAHLHQQPREVEDPPFVDDEPALRTGR